MRDKMCGPVHFVIYPGMVVDSMVVGCYQLMRCQQAFAVALFTSALWYTFRSPQIPTDPQIPCVHFLNKPKAEQFLSLSVDVFNKDTVERPDHTDYKTV